MRNYIFIIILLNIVLIAETIKPRVIRAHDGGAYRGGYRHSRGGPVSSVEATTEMSMEITSIGMTGASSDATTNEPRRGRYRGRYAELEFLRNNKEEITQDMSQGGGEHLSTLLTIMNVKRDRKTVSKIQSNFDSLSTLNEQDLLSKLREISS